MEPSIAVKGFVVNDGKLLLIKRRSNDVHCAEKWEIPGGRLDKGEDPYLGAKREIFEETGLNATVLVPMSVNYYTREDGQTITAIVFACRTNEDAVTLSEEHTEFRWLPITDAKDLIFEPMKKEIDRYEELGLKDKIKTLSEPNYLL